MRCRRLAFLMVKMMTGGKVWAYAADTSILFKAEFFAAGYAKVSADRQKKIDRFRFQKDKVLSLGAALLLGQCLEKHGVISYTVSVDTNGKPYLDKYAFKSKEFHEPLYFNLSHSEERVMCVISDREVGCDVEKVRGISLDIAEHFFEREEYEEILSQTTKESQRECFFRYWTLKESRLKAEGQGIIRDLKNCPMGSQKNPGYFFKEYDLSDGYKYAVCSRAEDFLEKLEWMELKIK